MPDSSQPSNGARARYLSSLPPEKQVEVLLRAERDGPGPHDTADWLVAQAAAEAAERIEAAVKKVADRDDQLGRIEEHQKQQAAKLQTIEVLVRYNGQMPDTPFGSITRYFLAFAAGAGVCELIFFAVSYRWLPLVFDRVGMFVLGLSATAVALLWLWLYPIVKATRW